MGTVRELHPDREPIPWWPQAQAISNQYATTIRAARAVGDHATVAELAANQRTELAKVMSHA